MKIPLSIEQSLIDVLTDVATSVAASRAALEAQLATTQNATRLRAHRPIPIGAGGVRLAWAGPGRLTGWTLHNPSTAAPALVRLLDARDTTGDPIAIIAIPPATSRDLAGASISFGQGLFADLTGQVAGVVWIGPEQ